MFMEHGSHCDNQPMIVGTNCRTICPTMSMAFGFVVVSCSISMDIQTATAATTLRLFYQHQWHCAN
jgi:hypothetical protein